MNPILAAAEVDVLILTHSQVRELLPMRECMDAVAEALADLARGRGSQPLRSEIVLPDRQGVLAWMPGSLASGKPFGIKILSVLDGAAKMGLDSHQGGVMIFDPESGSPLALLEAGAITAVRTAAVSALATERLARKDAATLAVLGAGTQARSHIEAMLEVRSFGTIRIWGRDPKAVERVISEQAARHGVRFEASADVRSAVAGADVVCTTTSARKPILFGDMLEEGMHINAVGASVPSWLEIDPGVVPRSTLFTDRRESLENEAGEYRRALERGVIDGDHLRAEIGEVLIGGHPGRTSEDEITLFRSLGLAVEDIAAGRLVYERALERGIGIEVDLAG